MLLSIIILIVDWVLLTMYNRMSGRLLESLETYAFKARSKVLDGLLKVTDDCLRLLIMSAKRFVSITTNTTDNPSTKLNARIFGLPLVH